MEQEMRIIMSNDFRKIRAIEKGMEQRRLAGTAQTQSTSPFPSGYIPKPPTRLDRAEGATSKVVAGIHMLIALAFTNVFVVLVIVATPYL
jgi:hypothetical protein